MTNVTLSDPSRPAGDARLLMIEDDAFDSMLVRTEKAQRRRASEIRTRMLQEAPQVRGLAVRDDYGEATRLAGSLREITDRKEVEEQVTYAAFHDALTGLPNRALFMDRLETEMKRSRRRPEMHVGLIFVDLDRFRAINDGLGQLIGDKLLCAVARRLEASLRVGDTPARLGGGEFAILLEDVKERSEVEAVAKRIDEAVHRPFVIDGTELFVVASIGYALSAPSCDDPEDLLRDAALRTLF